jgi:hypothetical protein
MRRYRLVATKDIKIGREIILEGCVGESSEHSTFWILFDPTKIDGLPPKTMPLYDFIVADENRIIKNDLSVAACEELGFIVTAID